MNQQFLPSTFLIGMFHCIPPPQSKPQVKGNTMNQEKKLHFMQVDRNYFQLCLKCMFVYIHNECAPCIDINEPEKFATIIDILQ